MTFKDNVYLTKEEQIELSKKRIGQIDRETITDGKEFGIQQEECIKFKQHSDCKLFRCVVCWHIIHPTDDEIVTEGDGFAHKICVSGRNAFPRALTIQERMDEERTECLRCHHRKSAHLVNGQCAGVKTKGTASGNQKQMYWFCKCKKYTKGTKII